MKRGYRALCDRATYVHLGRTAAMNLAPSTRRLFDARFRLVMAPISLMASAIAAGPDVNIDMRKGAWGMYNGLSVDIPSGVAMKLNGPAR
jgi:hypothetical protein